MGGVWFLVDQLSERQIGVTSGRKDWRRGRDSNPRYRFWPQVELEKAKIVVTNFHAFLLREKVEAGKLTKAILKAKKGRLRHSRKLL